MCREPDFSVVTTVLFYDLATIPLEAKTIGK